MIEVMNRLTLASEPEFVGQIVDILEDYLQENEIYLFNPDRDQAIADGEYEDPDEAAMIYGYTYGVIADTVRDVIFKNNLMKKQIDSYPVMYRAMNEILTSYNTVLDEGDYHSALPQFDYYCLSQKIISTFKNWGIYTE